MSRRLGLRLRHRHRLRYRLTRQRQYSLAVLRLSHEEAQARVREQLQDNPALEQAPPPRQQIDPGRYAEYLASRGAAPAAATGGERPPIDALPDRRPSLADHLAQQLRLGELHGDELQLGLHIAGNLDRDGYLRGIGLQQLADDIGIDLARAARVLEVVQQLDPVGVAARDLRECLLIQIRCCMRQLTTGEDLALVEHIVADHLQHLEHKRYQALADALGVEVAAIEEAVEVIRGFNPRPGSDYQHDEALAITPDVTVRKEGDDYVVEGSDFGLSRVRISSYAQQVARADAKAKQFIEEQFRKAEWLVKSIEERHKTIVRITESIVRQQSDFFERGSEGLKPLTLRDVAEDVGLHPSTVSRATTNKYAGTPDGVIELRSLFSGAVRRDDGGEVATSHVKRRIRELVAAEDKREPLTDTAMKELLLAEGICVVRRTVTKYRNQLGIVSAARRRIVKR